LIRIGFPRPQGWLSVRALPGQGPWPSKWGEEIPPPPAISRGLQVARHLPRRGALSGHVPRPSRHPPPLLRGTRGGPRPDHLTEDSKHHIFIFFTFSLSGFLHMYTPKIFHGSHFVFHSVSFYAQIPSELTHELAKGCLCKGRERVFTPPSLPPLKIWDAQR